jgi:hypothetical protein
VARRAGRTSRRGDTPRITARRDRRVVVVTVTVGDRTIRHRGIEVCSDLAARFGLHAFDCLNMGSSFLDVVLKNSAGPEPCVLSPETSASLWTALVGRLRFAFGVG